MRIKSTKINIFLLLLLIFIIIESVLFWGLRSYISKFNDAAFLSSFLSQKTGYIINIKTVKITSLNKLLIEELQVEPPKNIKKPGNSFFVKKILISFDAWKIILKKNIRYIKNIELTEPRLDLTSDYLSFSAKRAKAASIMVKGDLKKSRETKPAERLPIIIIKSGSVSLTLKKIPFSVEKIHGKITGFTDDINFELSGRPGSLDALCKVSGRLHGQGKKEIIARFERLDLGTVRKFAGISAPMSGKLNFQAEGKGTDKLAWRGNLSSERLIISNIDVSRFSSRFLYKNDIIYLSGLSAAGAGKNLAGDASAHFKENRINFNPLILSNSHTSVRLYGNLFYRQNQMDITSYLGGQSIAALSTLFGSSINDINGNLYGRFYAKGNTAKPNCAYNGRFANIIYKDVPIGNGALNISAYGESINGILELDKSFKYTIEIFQGAATLHVFFKISGTFKKPIITPIAKYTKIDTPLPRINIVSPEITELLKQTIKNKIPFNLNL